MTKRPMTFFVWVQSMSGPRPLKVFADSHDEPAIDEKLRQHVLAKHSLHAHEIAMTFSQLEALYPPPKEACN